MAFKRAINKETILPKYYQLKEIIKDKINKKELKPGDKLDSEYKLADKYGIAYMTVRHGVEELVKEGLLYREQGKGTFVNPTASRRSHLVGVVFPTFPPDHADNLFYMRIVSGIRQAIAQTDFDH